MIFYAPPESTINKVMKQNSKVVPFWKMTRVESDCAFNEK
jgi:ribosomal protein L39E